MGSWGPGLKANDDAMDVIGHYKARIGGIERTKKASARRKKAEALFVEIVKEGKMSDAFSILGLADRLLDAKVDLSGIYCIERALHDEKQPSRLAGWREENDCVKALANFEKRLNGKSVSAKDLALDNAGLFQRMGQSNATLSGQSADPAAELVTRLEEAQSMLLAATKGALIPQCFRQWEKIAEGTIKKAKPDWQKWPT